ncbi:MAG: hypothetical protein GXO32_03345 [Crenarchaeota archaeon]|nr:hypothetical protein [Thermoproteota archaeon]
MFIRVSRRARYNYALVVGARRARIARVSKNGFALEVVPSSVEDSVEVRLGTYYAVNVLLGWYGARVVERRGDRVVIEPKPMSGAELLNLFRYLSGVEVVSERSPDRDLDIVDVARYVAEVLRRVVAMRAVHAVGSPSCRIGVLLERNRRLADLVVHAEGSVIERAVVKRGRSGVETRSGVLVSWEIAEPSPRLLDAMLVALPLIR